MDVKESAALGDLAEHHWYYLAKAAAMCRYIGDRQTERVLDVGAGSAYFTKYLLRNTSAAAGVCVDTGYEHESDEQFVGKTLQFRRSCGPVSADLVLLMDVLEHVDNDSELLHEYATRVPRGTRFLITVPAFQWLWSDHDVFLEHRRRYTIKQLETAVANAALVVERSSYFFGLVLPLAAALRLAASLRRNVSESPRSQLQSHSWATNTLLALVCRAEMPMLRLNRLGGLSVFCLAHKA